MFLFTGEARLWPIAIGAAILCVAEVLGGATRCGQCSCERDVIDTSAAVLYINCTRSGTSKEVPVPSVESYNYTEIRAEFEHNKIAAIQAAIFKGLPVTCLDLADNEIRRIAAGTLSKMPRLKELDLSRNKLTDSLNAKVFQGLESLEVLDLSANGILNLESTVFYSLQSLKTLKLSMNFFKELASDLFMSVRDLEVLHLQQNALTGVNKVTFHTLDKLRYLDLSGNRIETIDEDLFEVSTQLVTLKLSSNNVTSLSPNVFKGLKVLRELDLGGNRLRGLDKQFHLPRTLRVLSIAHNRIKDAGILFQDFEDLQELYAQDNELDKLDVVTALTRLRVLNISSNILKSFPLQTYPVLRVLDLSNNLFPSIPSVVTAQYLPSLNHLLLDANPLSQIKFPPTKATFVNLTYVSFSNLPALRDIPARAFATLGSRGSARYVEEAVETKQLTRKKREPLSDSAVTNNSLSTPADAILSSAEKTESVQPIEQVDDAMGKTVVIRESKEVTESPGILESKEVSTKDIVEPLGIRLSKELNTKEVEEPLGIRVSTELNTKEAEEPLGIRLSKELITKEVEEPLVIRENKEVSNKEVEESLVLRLSKELNTKEVEEPLVIRENKEVSTKEVEEPLVLRENIEANTKDREETLGIRVSEVSTKGVTEPTKNSKELVAEPRGIVSREVGDEERKVDEDRRWTMESEEGGRLGALRKEPGVMVAVSDVRQYENVHVEGEGAGSDCQGGMTLRIAMNKNLMKIHADAFKGVDICELDLSSNSLSSIPENVLDWTAVRSVDLQRNPWDCSCRLQWLLNVLVPKLYNSRPDLLYELRCATPAMLFERRFVHFFNWTEPAFCIEHKFEQQIKKSANGTDTREETVNFGSSNGMLIAIGCALFLVVTLVAMGVFYQWRVVNRRRRVKNRRA